MNDRTGAIEKITELSLTVAAEVAKATANATSPAAILLRDSGFALLPGVGTAIVSVAAKAYERRIARKLDEWFNLVAMFLEMGATDEAKRHVEEHLDEDWAQSGVIEGARAVLNDIDDAALPALARLCALRLKGTRVLDNRDKRAMRLLCACDRTLFEATRVIVVFCLESFPLELRNVEVMVSSSTSDANEERTFSLRIQRPGVEDHALALIAETPATPEFLRAFHLLKQYEFARDNPSGFFGVMAGPHLMVISKEDLDYLGGVL
jgi:hypothetical protein